MGIWDKIKKTLLHGFWPEPLKSSRSSARKTLKRKSSSPYAPAKASGKKIRSLSVRRNQPPKAADRKRSSKPRKRKAAEAGKLARMKRPRPKAKPPALKEKPSPGELIGTVTHYFPQVNVAALKVEKRGLMTGETIHIQGHTTKFKTVIKSMQINRKPVLSASIGDEIGILVPRRVRAGDQVFFKP